MKIYYGKLNNLIDVTTICATQLISNNVITIPSGDNERSRFFSDPLVGVHKYIYIEQDDGTINSYDESLEIKINVLNEDIHFEIKQSVDDRIRHLHSILKIKNGSFNDELPEQKMAVRYLTGDEKVLEIGGNIGRNSLIIASMLKNDNNLVTLESDPNIAKQLTENRDINNLKFHIENSAISKRKLIQKKWDTIPSDVLLDGYQWVNTISLDNLRAKYSINFDTLVLDCEGAFYFILMDMPEILDGINLIIMENDYWDLSKKNYVDDVLKENGFHVAYRESGGWGPCYNNFFEVWKK